MLASVQPPSETSTTCIMPSSSWFIMWQCSTYFPVKSRNRVRKVMLPPCGTITVSIRSTDCGLEADVIDTGVGFSGGSGTGIGLANIRARLQTLYGGSSTLTLQANTPHGVRATLRLPLEPPARTA